MAELEGTGGRQTTTNPTQRLNQYLANLFPGNFDRFAPMADNLRIARFVVRDPDTDPARARQIRDRITEFARDAGVLDLWEQVLRETTATLPGWAKLVDPDGNAATDASWIEWVWPPTGEVERTQVPDESLPDTGGDEAGEVPPGGTGGSDGSDAGGSAPTTGGTTSGGGGDDFAENIPGGGEVWKVGKSTFLVYFVPDTNVPMAWKVRNDELLQFLGSQDPTPDRTMSWSQARSEGMLEFGFAEELQNTSEHPFDAFVADYKKEAEIRPWLREPEILALTAGAFLEGRQVTEAELKTTDWWESTNPEQRSWIALSASDPEAARRTMEDARMLVSQLLIGAGVRGAPDTLVDAIASNWTTGKWTETYARTQINIVGNPAVGQLDRDLAPLVRTAGEEFGRAVDDIDAMRQLVESWIGPAFAGGWSNAQLQDWSRRINANEAQREVLIDELRRQRLALYPEYQDIDLRYEDIAAPWRGVVQSMWGEVPDETDPLFIDLVRTNDMAIAQQRLREEGVRRGNGTVTANAVNALSQAFGGGVLTSVV